MRAASALVLAALAAAGSPATAETAFPARLAGHAVLPAFSLLAPPADAPRDAWISGKFVGPERNARPMSVDGNTGPLHGRRETGVRMPFLGQPLQGFSGFSAAKAPDGSFVMLTDNGFGAKANSPDALLFFHHVGFDFEAGETRVVETVFLRDPDHLVPFRIAYEGTEARYLTGADFDPESIQIVGDSVWIGEEFGPFLIRATLDGRVTGVFPTRLEGKDLRSPDHPAVRAPASAGEDFQVPRSGGYEGMAATPDGATLWALLEKPLLGPSGEAEGRFLRLLAFDPAKGDWTGETAKFALAEGATAIGDFNMIDATRALIIERDDGEGDPSLACADPKAPTPDCFPLPARVKRIVLVDLAQRDAEGFVRRIGHIDLMAIADPEGRARLPTAAARDLAGSFTFPFFTIENVVAVSPTQILVGNDNNLPFSSGRQLDAAAANEVILLDVAEFLAAK